MKKLLIATDSFLPRWDGVARFLSEIIPGLKDYEVTVLAPAFPGRKIEYKGVRIMRVPLMNLQFGDYTPPKFDRKLVKQEVKNADIVFTQTLGPIGSLAVKYSSKYKKKTVAFIHSIEWELLALSTTRYTVLKKLYMAIVHQYAKGKYNKCDLLIVPSKSIGTKLERSGIKTKKVVVHLGTNVDKFKQGNMKQAKKKIGITPNKLVVGFCGRIGREKDLPTLYKAFKKIKKRYNAVLLIVGKGIEDLPKDKDVKMVGAKENVVPYLQAMDIYVLPSLTETTSLSTMEAMSCGLAVISTPVGYVKNYIENGVNGYFFSKGDHKELSRTLEMLLDNQDMRKRLGQNARKTILKKYSWKKTIKKITKILKKL